MEAYISIIFYYFTCPHNALEFHLKLIPGSRNVFYFTRAELHFTTLPFDQEYDRSDKAS